MVKRIEILHRCPFKGWPNTVGHGRKIIKILHRCPFEGWPSRAQPSKPICQKGWDGRALLGQPLKGHLCRMSILFSIMFYYIISTTYQKIGDLFWPGIYLDFRTVWSCTRSCTSCWMQQGFFAYFLLMMLRLDGEVCANRVKSKFLPRVWQVDAL